MVSDHQAGHLSQWATINSIAGKVGCTGEALRGWGRQAERNQGVRGSLELPPANWTVVGWSSPGCRAGQLAQKIHHGHCPA